jgi:hypothetical protein
MFYSAVIYARYNSGILVIALLSQQQLEASKRASALDCLLILSVMQPKALKH